ncbi:hypothetical protein LOAG_04063 [Loa loa]|uniref:NKG2-D type II integral membrane protein n=1 Tax=Loa loa TaxID=7209 RepID=A0A1I7VNK6_LOALO|nr:hypothetical protein LOAG_04063 [Loa loa]EFO24427.1 hypothetical protein LOAG_04063 [Loa loa]
MDGRIRSTTIQMPNGKELDRSINTLCPMEIHGSKDIEENLENKTEGPIASQTRSAKALQTHVESKDKSNFSVKTLLLITMISLMSIQVVAIKNCKWNSGVLNIPEV